MTETCTPPITIGDPAIQLVGDGWTTFQSWAEQAFLLAREQIADLTSFTVSTPPIVSSFTVNADLSAFRRPERPEPIEVAYNPDNITEPGEPPEFENEPVEFVAFPAFSGEEPGFSFPSYPGELNVAQPGEAPALTAIVIPGDPNLSIPDAPPDLLPIDIPDPLELEIPEFTGERPLIDFDVPAETWSYTPEDYVSALLTSVQARITAMLAGGTGLPAAVEDALRERAYAEVEREEVRAVQQATTEMATRGFDEPNGILADRILQVRQGARNQRLTLSRDIYIRAQEVEIENLRFAVQQGIALESTLIGLHMRMQELLLESNKFIRDSSIAIYNARVTLFNTRMQGYATDAQVFRDLIQGELAKIELFKAEIDAEKLKTEVNKNLVDIYEQQIRAVLAQAEVYNAQVAGVRAQAEVNASIMDGYRARVAAYAERVRAYAESWAGFRSRVEGEIGKARIWETTVNAFATRVRAVAENNQNLIAQKQLDISVNETDVRVFLARLQRTLADIQAERDRVASEVAVFGGEVALYQAETNVERVVSEVDQRGFELALTEERARVDAQLKAAEVAITSAIQQAGLMLEAIKGRAVAAAQLAGASMSAVNFSAGVTNSSSTSEGTNCSTSYSYSGELGT